MGRIKLMAIAMLFAILPMTISAQDTVQLTDGEGALIKASREGDLAALKILVKNGNDVNSVDNKGWTALMYAAQKGYADVVQFLIDSGADVNLVDPTNTTGWTALMGAAQEGYPNIVKILLGAGADPNLQSQPDGYTAAIWAAKRGHLETLKLLIEGGTAGAPEGTPADINIADALGRTAIMYAKNADIAKALYDAGADIMAVDTAGDSVLMNNYYGNRASTVKFLLDLKDEAGEPVLAFSEEERGKTNDLILAAALGNLEEVRILVKHIGINTVDNQGYTALMRAAANGYVEVVRLLLESGADVNVKVKSGENRGKTALDMAAESGNGTITDLINGTGQVKAPVETKSTTTTGTKAPAPANRRTGN